MHRLNVILIALLFTTAIACAGLEQYSNFVVADHDLRAAPRRGAVRVTYLGTNGYQLEAGGHALLIDPYFTRVSLCSVAFGQRIETDTPIVDAALVRLRPKIDAVLATHAHFDHLLDAPRVMRRSGARLVAGPSAINLVRSLGIPASQCRPIHVGETRRIGPWTIHALEAQHDRLLGLAVPYPGEQVAPGRPPVKPADWVLGEPLAFLIEAAGLRIYVDSGGAPGLLPPVDSVDLAILGVALRDSRLRFAGAVRRLHPRYVLPSHQDDFFQPLALGFQFGKLSDFPQVRQIFENENLPGRLILLDYFRPWTLE